MFMITYLNSLYVIYSELFRSGVFDTLLKNVSHKAQCSLKTHWNYELDRVWFQEFRSNLQKFKRALLKNDEKLTSVRHERVEKDSCFVVICQSPADSCPFEW